MSVSVQFDLEVLSWQRVTILNGKNHGGMNISNPMLKYVVKKEDIIVAFISLMTDITQVAVQNIENSITVRIIKVIKDNLVLSQSQIAEILGEKHDTIKYHMMKMRLYGIGVGEGLYCTISASYGR